MNYRRLLPDRLDHFDQPINGSFLADLDALFRGDSLGNSGRVAEEMVSALLRILRDNEDLYEDLIAFLETAFGRERLLLHRYDGSSDSYMRLRTEAQPHGDAMEESLSGKTPERREDDGLDWVIVPPQKDLSLQELYVQGCSPNPPSNRELLAAQTRYALAILHLSTYFNLYRGPMKLSRGDNASQTFIARTSEVSTAASTIEEDMCIVAVTAPTDKSDRQPPPVFCSDQYTLVLLSGVENESVLERIDTNIWPVNVVPSIVELSNGTWEICVRKSHCHIFHDTLGKIFPNSSVDLDYDPCEPTANDVELWGRDAAKKLYQDWFSQRATRIIEEGWPAAATYYTYLLELKRRPHEATAGSISPQSFNRPLAPTYRGYLQNKADVVYLLEHCLQGKLTHSWRGPRDDEAAVSGNIFVWEAKSAGIDHWRDGLEWNVREKDGFEVGEATNGSGLMKKTASISARGVAHRMVSYYTEEDAPTLARPSRETTLRPELVSILEASDPPGSIQTMKLSDIIYVRDGVFELQKGHGDQPPGDDDMVQILFGGIQTALTSKELAENDDVW